MDSGFSSPRRDTFPAGLRVLVVDDDPTWLRILEKMLKKCSYEVTTCGLAREALNLLRERKDGYDIVISDVNMPDMDGFKLLEHVGLEMDLPVIMMSVDGETSRVMKGVQHGACDYLLKPIRMKELRNIWQHVFRKRIHEAREFESHEGIHLLRSGTDQSDDGIFFAVDHQDMISIKKRKDVDNKYDDKEFGDPSSTKKARVVWSVDLHQKFVKAVNQIGFDKVGPKKILDLMNVPWLTRENVASHLQKYRLYLSRLQKENEQKCWSSGSKVSEFLPKDSSGKKQQNEVAVDSYNKYSSDAALESHDDAECELKGMVAESSTEKRRALSSSIPMESEGRRHAVFDQSQSIASVSSNPCIETKPLNADYKSDHASSESGESSSSKNMGMKTTQGFNVSCISDLDFYPKNILWGSEVAYAPLDEDLHLYWLQGECCNIEMPEYYDPGILVTEVPNHLYDSSDYSIVDQGLFIA